MNDGAKPDGRAGWENPVHTRRLLLWLGAGFLVLGVAIGVAGALHALDQMDNEVLRALAAKRPQWLAAAASDLTALGSFSVAAIVSTAAVVVFWLEHQRNAALQVLIAFTGATACLHLVKNIIQRPRPDEISRLVHTAGYSYPSGHSLTAAALYLTFAMVGARLLTTRKARVAVATLAILIILLVGLSRVYLGVHYPSDVAGGFSLGAAWAFLVAAAFSRARQHGLRHRASCSP